MGSNFQRQQSTLFVDSHEELIILMIQMMNTTMAKTRKQRLPYSHPRRFSLGHWFLLLLLHVSLRQDVKTTCHAGIFPSVLRKRWSFRVSKSSSPTPTVTRTTFFPETAIVGPSPSPSLPLSIARHGGTSDSKESSSQSGSSSSPQTKTSLNKQLVEIRRKLLLLWDDLVTGTVHQEGSRFLHHVLYWFTAMDAVHSIILNDYSNILGSSNLETTTAKNFVPSVYSRLFYFARLRPRLLYAIGALLRALQLCTPFRRILDPTAGVGAGINLCALLAGSRWVKPLVLGWATTRWLWTWLGARQVDKAYLPITLSIHEWEEKKKHAKKSAARSDNSSE